MITIRWGGKSQRMSLDEALSMARAIMGAARVVAPERVMCLADDYATPPPLPPVADPAPLEVAPVVEQVEVTQNEACGYLQKVIVEVVGSGGGGGIGAGGLISAVVSKLGES